jgi:hypothetical protein
MGFDEFVTYSTIDSTALTGYTNTFKAYADANASIYGSTPPVEANRKGADVLV